MKRKLSLVLLTYDSLYANPVFLPLLDKEFLNIKTVVLSDCILYKKSKIKSLLFLLKHQGWIYFVFKVLDQFLYTITGLGKGKFSKKKRLLWEAEKRKIPVIKIEDINSQKSCDLLKSLKPDIIVSYFNQLLKSEVLGIPKIGCINVHPGYLPLYKGVASSFWARCNGEKFGGVTVHTMVEKLDSGKIYAREKVYFAPDESLHKNNYRCLVAGGRLLLDVLKKIYENKVTFDKPTEKPNYYSWPSPESVKKYLEKGYKLIKIGDLGLYPAWRGNSF